MAIYHLRASVISRSQGRSATASAAYRAAERITDGRTGLTFDYAARGGVEHTEILAPDDAPDWVHDRSKLWNRVEAAERRVNSQVAREIRVALPNELGPDERAELVRDFCQAQFVERGMVADIALHAPSDAGDERNHHAHILLTTRRIGPDGFTTKDRDWNKTEALESWREAWSYSANRALERSGREERIDHRTLEAQKVEAWERASAARGRGDEAEELQETVRAISLDRPPLPQLSPGAWQMKERGHEVGAVRAWYEAKAYARNVSQAVQELGGHVRDWLDRQATRVLGRPEPDLAAAGQPAAELDWSGLAARLRGAEPDQVAQAEAHSSGREREREDPAGLVDRLRGAFDRLDRDDFAEKMRSHRETLESEERARDQEAKRVRAEEVKREREQEELRQREEMRARSQDRDSGLER